MKRAVILFLAALLAGAAMLAGCSGNRYHFVKSAEPLDLFQKIADNGGIPLELDIKLDGSGELVAQFSNLDNPIESWVKDMNEVALSRDRYADGERVVEVKNIKRKLGKLQATFYFPEAAKLNNPEFDVMTLSYYLKHSSVDNINFYNKKMDSVSVSNLKGDSVVLVLRGYTNNMLIKVGGKITAASSGMADGEYKRSSIRYTNDSCVIVFQKSYLWEVVITISVLAVLAIVFFILVKCRVFTALKVKLAKKK